MEGEIGRICRGKLAKEIQGDGDRGSGDKGSGEKGSGE